jgi:hypothetical protein
MVQEEMMRADTQAISIDAAPSRVIGFLANGANLPRWAVGFAKSAAPDGGGWLVTTGAGPVRVSIDSDARAGVVDFRLEIAPGLEGLAATRVVPRGTGSEVIFTQFQSSGMPDDVFAKNVEAVSHELRMLKALLEVDCPR